MSLLKLELLKLMAVPIASTCTLLMRRKWERLNSAYTALAWRECTFYSDAEKVALELTEHITLIPDKRVPDELYERVRKHFDEKAYVDLVILINQINSWNRISIAMGNVAE